MPVSKSLPVQRGHLHAVGDSIELLLQRFSSGCYDFIAVLHKCSKVALTSKIMWQPSKAVDQIVSASMSKIWKGDAESFYT